MLNSQTFEWAHIKPVNISTNPFYLKNTVSTDNEGNPVYSHLLNSKYISTQSYYGDVELVKRNPDGIIIWNDTIFGKIDMLRILIDNHNNIICTGTFKDSIIVDENNFLFSSSSSPQSFIFKIDENGNTLWLKNLEQHFQSFYTISSAVLDDAGNIWIAADNFGNSTIYKLDTEANLITSIEQINVRGIGDISIDNTGCIWVTGAATGFISQSFNGLDTIPPFSYNEYVVKYSSSGEALWIVFIEDVTFQRFRIVTDETGSAYLAGNLFISTWFGNIQANAPAWVYSYFLTKVDPDGNFIWLYQTPSGSPPGDAGVEGSNFLYCDQNGYVYLTGFMRNNLNYGNGIVLNTYGSYDAFVLKYNSDGELKWALNGGSAAYDKGTTVTADKFGNCYLAGFVSENAVFGNINLAGGNLNQFITKISDDVVPVELSSLTASVNGNSVTLKWNTSSELNNRGFEIQKLQNYKIPKLSEWIPSEQDWIKVGFVEGKGTAAGVTDYSFEDVELAAGIYSYRLKQIDFDETFQYSPTVEVEIGIPEQFTLFQNYPNPFNPNTTISWQSSAGSWQTLKVYDLLGREVATLIDEYKPAGSFEVEFDASGLTSGTYYYKLNTEFFTDVKKFLLIK